MKTKNKTIIFYILLIGSILNFATNCSKDNSVNQTESPTISDFEGNVYHTVTIGTQTWMQENLKLPAEQSTAKKVNRVLYCCREITAR